MQYAIRPSVSSNKKFDRNTVIKTVADIVGPDHPVDLKNYDLVILVTVVQVSFHFILPSHSKLEIANVYAECHRDERSRKWLRPTKAVQFGRALQSNSEAASIWGDGVESIKVLYSSIICCRFLNTRGMPWIWASKSCNDIQYKLWYHYVHKNLQNLFSSTDTYEFITKKSYWFSRSTARVQLPSIAKRPKVKAMLC